MDNIDKAVILESAAEIMDAGGITHGDYREGEAHCTMGAIYTALGRSEHSASRGTEILLDVAETLNIDLAHIPFWNDGALVACEVTDSPPGEFTLIKLGDPKTKEEVIDVFIETSKRLRSK